MKLEICAHEVESLILAKKYAFDRVELCQALELGGLTPSAGFVELALQNRNFESHILIRPRAGHFVFSQQEKNLMLSEIKSYAERDGLKGFVVGALTESGELDVAWLKVALNCAPKHVFTFHRAFDEVKNWEMALEQLIDLGFKRILTSGQATSVLLGKATLDKMVSQAKQRIEIMCGGGVVAADLSQLVEGSSFDALHFSGSIESNERSNSNFATPLMQVNEAKIVSILNELANLGLFTSREFLG